ncbi:MAG: hypothetical protein AMJ73_01030 [candidate division Zixibacteria bacterium SM1_73]|nr:MAG: hypothetical protein AMJ73_01030 [candidate division Zixibacteria bacterium SM1_73]
MNLKVNAGKKKALIVGPLPPPYHGVAVMIKWLLDGLRKSNGLDFVHLNTQDRKKNKNFGKFTLRNSWFALRSILLLFGCLFNQTIEVVYIPISQNFWAFLRDSIFILTAGLLFRKKVVIHLHGGYFKTFYQNGSRSRKLYMKFAFRYVNRGIVLGHCLRHVLEDVLADDKIDVVYNGIDVKTFDEIESQREKNGKFKILFAGVLEESKGFFDLVKAVPTVARYYPHIQVFIAGRWQDNGLKNRVSTYIRENNLEEKIKFLGVVTGEQKIKLFKTSDLFVLPTYYFLGEGQPVVILEAMAAKLPVISTDKGSIKEMVTDGHNGFIISPSSPHQIAEKIAILIENERLREKMGEKSHRRVKDEFSLDQYLDGVIRTIEKSTMTTERGNI